jgi:hypothetical protein
MRNPTSPGHLGDIHLWDVASGREMYRFEDPGGGGMAGGLVFSPDGRFLVSAGLGGARVWDTADGRRVRAWDGDVLCVAFAPDGRSLVSVTDKEIVVRESAGGGVRWRIATTERRLYGSWGVPIAFTPDGRRLALLGEGFDVRVWDVESGQILQTFAGHRHGLTSVAFAPDGRTLATASLDTTVLLWATPDRPRPPVALSADDAAAAWADLAAGDAAVAYRAMTRLRADPGRSLPLLRERLTRAPAVDDGRVGRWVAELDDERFGVRQQAARELAALGERAAPALRRLLANRPTLEARRRAEELLAKLDELTPDPQLLRDLRAVEVLEAVGTPDARTLLEELARRDPEARLTREAQASLDRWRRR